MPYQCASSMEKHDEAKTRAEPCYGSIYVCGINSAEEEENVVSDVVMEKRTGRTPVL